MYSHSLVILSMSVVVVSFLDTAALNTSVMYQCYVHALGDPGVNQQVQGIVVTGVTILVDLLTPVSLVLLRMKS